MKDSVTIDVDNPKPTITVETIFVINKSKEHVRELMLQPQENNITYYAPIYTGSVDVVPDYSDTTDWRIESKDYIVDLFRPHWHHGAEEIIEWIKGSWFAEDYDMKFRVLK